MGNVISVVSGKGGCGKSLLTAVIGQALAREGAKVLLVDMDIFVRGLTVLLHKFRRPSDKSGKITVSDILGVFDENSADRGPVDLQNNNFKIQRFLDCDVLPAVQDIGEPLDYNDRDLSNEQFGEERIHYLLDVVRDNYDYIFLDNRAGMDSLISASCKNSDIVLSVAEDDDVGRQTNVNLVNFLRFKKRMKNIYSVINKGRNIKNYDEIQARFSQRHEFSVVGYIPFDIEVLEEFGSDKFWLTVNETLYFRAVLDAWNMLAKNERYAEISISKYKFPPAIFMKRDYGRYSLIERMLRTYSILFIIGGFGMWFYDNVLRFTYDSSFRIKDLSPLLIALGVMLLILSTSNFRRALIRLFEGKHKE